ncbi:hypothetical protein ABW19_dt0201645 [Dactylella cylindrospora]|nr:hypothetical protein ABW19_dt0201645 [Dactylella cylindrospora]
MTPNIKPNNFNLQDGAPHSSPPLKIPPLSFALVSPGVYRSGCPMPLNFPFLSKLHLKSIIYLADQDLPDDLHRWTADNKIKVFHFRVQHVRGEPGQLDALQQNSDAETEVSNGTTAGGGEVDVDGKGKEKVENDPKSMKEALELLLDNRNFPVLIHSNKGKHRSGVLVACMRKLLQNWAFVSVKLEYHYFAGDKGETDVEFIQNFEPTLEYDERWAPRWLRYSVEEGRLIKTTKT